VNAAIELNDDISESIDKGEAIVLAVAIYNIKDERLSYVFVDNVDRDEGVAILRKFNCLPPKEQTVNTEDL
jgi:hypothetical protein